MYDSNWLLSIKNKDDTFFYALLAFVYVLGILFGLQTKNIAVSSIIIIVSTFISIMRLYTINEYFNDWLRNLLWRYIRPGNGAQIIHLKTPDTPGYHGFKILNPASTAFGNIQPEPPKAGEQVRLPGYTLCGPSDGPQNYKSADPTGMGGTRLYPYS